MQPTFSIIIPTFNRPQKLKSCLESLARLDYPRDRFEVAIVDDESDAPPDAAVAPFRAELDILLLKQSHAGPAAARNTGAAAAKGRYLAFTDDDCQPAPDWLTKLAARYGSLPDCAIGGRTVNGLTHNPYAACSQLLIDYLYSHYQASSGGLFFTSNNLALPAEMFRKMGGFDTTFTCAGGEDRELCNRWLAQGYPMLYAAEAIVYHFHTLDLFTFWRQHFNYGRGAFRFHRLRAASGQRSLRVEPLSFYFKLLRFPFAKAQNGEALLQSALLFVTQAANASGFFWEMASRPNSRLSTIRKR
ncbi:MAG TPA: glycosyltransferase [Candidatus Eisenbacteria bacterium]|nr:glycosyltransferase [Candidatus Eisenbacteria bacterium]